MTVVDRALAILTEHVGEEKALTVVNALAKHRIGFVQSKGSADMLRRYKSHAWYLGERTGYGKQYWIDESVKHAMAQDKWPHRVMQQEVKYSGGTITVDVMIPESAKLASNEQLMCAYEVIQSGADEHGVVLPEHVLIGGVV